MTKIWSCWSLWILSQSWEWVNSSSIVFPGASVTRFVHFYIVHFIKIRPTPASFCLISFFSNTILQKNLIGIRTQIVGVEGEHADHLTTTTAQDRSFYIWQNFESITVSTQHWVQTFCSCLAVEDLDPHPSQQHADLHQPQQEVTVVRLIGLLPTYLPRCLPTYLGTHLCR